MFWEHIPYGILNILSEATSNTCYYIAGTVVIQQTFTELLWHDRHFSRHWAYSSRSNSQKSLLSLKELSLQERETYDKVNK